MIFPSLFLGVLNDLLGRAIPRGFIDLDFSVIMYFLVFVIFAYIAYKVLNVAFSFLFIFVAAGLFPVFASYVLGLPVDLSLGTVLSYALMGIIFYAIAFGLEILYKTLRAVFWPFRKIFGSSKEEEIDKEIRKEIEKERKKRK